VSAIARAVRPRRARRRDRRRAGTPPLAASGAEGPRPRPAL